MSNIVATGIFLLLWYGLGIVGATALLAEMRAEHPFKFASRRDARERRNDVFLDALLGPFIFFVMAYDTRFRYGFSLSGKPIDSPRTAMTDFHKSDDVTAREGHSR